MAGFIVAFPDPWQYSFCGGAAPFMAGPGVPQGVAVNNPPGFHRARNDQIFDVWWLPPLTLLETAQVAVGVAVNNPPVGLAANLDNLQVVVGSWAPDPSLYTFVGGNAPFGLAR